MSATPDSETRRLAALHALEILDSQPERELDDIAQLAAHIAGCPTGLVTLIDRDRQWIKAGAGDIPSETPRAEAFCDHTIRASSLMVVEDATQDVRFRDNSHVITPGGVRFYAGAPISVSDADGERHAIGALCVIADTPRTLGTFERTALIRLAGIAEALIAARRTTRDAVALAGESQRQAARLTRQDQVFRQAESMTRIGSWRLTIASGEVEWSDGVFHIHGLPVGMMPDIDRALDFYPPHARVHVAAAVRAAIEQGTSFDLEVDFTTAQGAARRVRTMGERESTDGVSTALVGVFQDVTERHVLETSLRRSANTDALTGLMNRAAFERALETAMAFARAQQTPLLLAVIDLDGFKVINDTLGHNAGDDVLREVGRVLQMPWLCGSPAARLGGDEFAIIVSDPQLMRVASGLGDRLEQELRLPIQVGGTMLMSAGTVGIAALAADLSTVRDFVHRADTQLYAAKRARVADGSRKDRRAAA